jgi:hypothetical protein
MRNATKWSVAPRQSRAAQDRDGATVRVRLDEGGDLTSWNAPKPDPGPLGIPTKDRNSPL